ncbi:helix-turn-helix transcriptional regulator [Bacillus haynesii]|uniref:helix-turn-helix domain-containing protein n=1 Tax=Bacillus paralicheniformis TaxID=1648923 RepID=UPI000BA510ED|nr:helix-turn-helix transcriptional regulator [Bacillus paralicheniformis]MEC0552278.1 helix-turn-helix transcriptional regulator [Bacillus haynesii]PAD00132.1 transcriptional regulator [Bacillus paralicheniformis]
MTLAERLKYLRSIQRPRLSQEALSKKLGFNRATYAKYETGDNNPDYDSLIKIADFYGVSLDYLIRGESKDSQDKILEDEAKKILNDPKTFIAARDGEITQEILDAALEIITEQLKEGGKKKSD